MGEPTLAATLETVLGTPPRMLTPLGASFAGRFYQVQSDIGMFALKWAEHSAPGALAAEARGLQLLAASGAVRVPHVQHIHDPSATGGVGPAFLLIEWLDGGSTPDMAALGAALAKLHRQTDPIYGLDHDNFIGGTPQQNTPHADWPTFFRDRRLAPQIALAARQGRLSAPRQRGLERLLERLGELLGTASQPSLIHGDLWRGNVLAASDDGTPALIDPAVSYSNREAELAFTELFGGFGPRFLAAYEDAWPLDPGYTDRRDLYNLYHLLNHLNLFGEGYGPQVDAVIRRYVG